jgi:DNA-binding transcriptional MerR regulator
MGEIPPNTEAAPVQPKSDQSHIDQPEIPDKLYFRIGEVSHLVGVEAYVLRYWESEFPGLSPRKSSSGQRMFRRKDVELLLRIKHLLYSQKFTIEGARKALSDQNREKSKPGVLSKLQPVKQAELFAADPLVEIRREIFDIIKLLSAH